MHRSIQLLGCLMLCLAICDVDSFSFLLMGRRKGGLQKTLLDEDGKGINRNPSAAAINSLNQGKGQEIFGVSLPAEGTIKGWEFGEQKTLVCANVDGKFHALQGNCPRCGFDLFRGDLIANDPAWEDLPRIACPTCATTYSLVSGKKGPPIVRKGLAGFVGGLAKTATTAESNRDAEAFQITLDEEGRVYCRAKNIKK